jgi:DNA-binding CsgD family transcriptional regulator
LARLLLLETYAPPSVLIDESCACLAYFGPVENYLQLEGDSLDLFAIAHPGLRLRLKAALRARGLKETRLFCEARPEPGDRFGAIEIAVLVLPREDESLFLVSFLDPEAFVQQKRARPAALALGAGQMRAPARHAWGGDHSAAVEQIACLSPRQRAVLDLVADGRSNKQIAGELGITPRTVESHRAIVMRKLGARSFADLMRLVAAFDSREALPA